MNLNKIYNKITKDKASTHQKTTITRPQSIFSDSSFSLPTAYYERTTPYFPDNTTENIDIDDEIVRNGKFF